LFSEKGVPATACKTPASLMHVTEFWRHLFALGKKPPAAAGKTSIAHQCGYYILTNPRKSFLPNKAIVAAVKTLIGLIHVIESQEHHSGGKTPAAAGKT
jgi:hypothetical protein